MATVLSTCFNCDLYFSGAWSHDR